MADNIHSSKEVIGRVESIKLLDYSNQNIPAKIDTGADVSSIWVSAIHEANNQLTFELFAAPSKYYTGETITLLRKDYRLTRVANSFGAREIRYVVKLRILIKEHTIKASFTLADRSHKTYPVLLGRRLLHNKFLVDVTKGEPLSMEEAKKRRKLRLEFDPYNR